MDGRGWLSEGTVGRNVLSDSSVMNVLKSEVAQDDVVDITDQGTIIRSLNLERRDTPILTSL